VLSTDDDVTDGCGEEWKMEPHTKKSTGVRGCLVHSQAENPSLSLYAIVQFGKE
jgi:hypothetical protein